MMVGPGDEEGKVGLTAGVGELKHVQDGFSMMHFEVREIRDAASALSSDSVQSFH